jgi:hypothetical protein
MSEQDLKATKELYALCAGVGLVLGGPRDEIPGCVILLVQDRRRAERALAVADAEISRRLELLG